VVAFACAISGEGMRALTLAIAAGVLLSAGALAQNQNVVLTPTALYDLIEKQNVKTTKLTHVCLKLNSRVNELEREVARLKTASILTHQAVNKLRK
jgi:hypothetical protein